MATGLLSLNSRPTVSSVMAKPYSGPAISLNTPTTTTSSGLTGVPGKTVPNPLFNAPTPSLGIKAKTPATKAPVTTLPKAQVNTTPKPTVQATTDGGTGSTGVATKAADDSSNKYNTTTGALNTNYKDPNVTNVTGQPTPQNLGLYGSLINNAVQSTAKNQGITDNTQEKVDQTAENIANLRQGANTQEQAYQTGMLQPRAQGLAQNVASTEANQETALQGQLSNELTAGGQALTGAQQTTSGLLSSAGLAAPTGNIINVDPTTGLPVAGGSLGNLATLSGTVQGLQSGAAAQAAAGGNIAAQNETTTGTANTQTAAQGYANSLPSYQTSNTSFATATGQANNLLNSMNSLGINAQDSQDWNNSINGLSSKLGSTKTSQFTATLAEAQQSYTNLLASVGAATPTVNGKQAIAILNPGSTPAQISAAIDALNQAAYTKLEPQYQQALTYYNQLHGTNVNAIPGYPAPVKPATVSTAAPTGPNTSKSNILKEAGGAVITGVEDILGVGGKLLDWIGSL